MKQKVAWLITLTALVFTASLGWVVSGEAHSQEGPVSSLANAGNKFCPVSGDKISGKHFVVYKGKRYELCCPMCAKDFKKNPEKYIAKLK